MKKLILMSLFLFPFASFAQTTTVSQSQILALIASLTKQVQILASQNQPTVQVFAKGTITTPTTTPAQIKSGGIELPVYTPITASSSITIEEQEAKSCQVYTYAVPYKALGVFKIIPIVGTKCYEMLGNSGGETAKSCNC